MQLKQLATTLSLGLLCCTAGYSADVLINLNGVVIANACSVTAGSAEQYIQLGNWGAKQFTSTGSKIPPTKFTIDLENCNGSASGVTETMVTFTGVANDQNTQLLALNTSSTAKHVGIAILDQNKNIITPNTRSNIYSLDPNSRVISLTFYSQYVSTAQAVTAGSANADVTFTLTYQ